MLSRFVKVDSGKQVNYYYNMKYAVMIFLCVCYAAALHLDLFL
jgi:hypothetical protein